ncbi:MAG: VOC family protein [Defluviitaleaceae bacterium]|nr:VOC family protein [Defluviitaleaceae bacterium]
MKVTLITLGVADLAKSRTFYEGLGFEINAEHSDENIVLFNTGDATLSLYPIKHLATDVSSDAPPPIASGFSGITLAHNTNSKEAVNELFAKIKSLGGTIEKEPQEVFWGGYHFYFRDLDGHYWEIAYAY